MRRWPATIRVFLDFRMACVGCPITPFHTVADTCREHRADPVAFLAALRATASASSEIPESVSRTGALGYAKQTVRIA